MKQSDVSNKRWPPAYLQLSTGHVFPGFSIGAATSVAGEAVFQTGMVGYPEALTDPSYSGQLLVMTYPLIGNYGSPDPSALDEHGIPLYVESSRIHPAALVMAHYTHLPSHWNSVRPLHEWLRLQNVPAITGVDTRHLTKVIRSSGTLLARLVIHSDFSSPPSFVNPNLRNLVADVSSSAVRSIPGKAPPTAPRVLVIDCGVKNNQLRQLRLRASQLLVVPWNHSFQALDDADQFDAIFISNGPGDPVMAQITVNNLKDAMNRRPNRPIFGICLGHQLLARAAGFSTYKLKYGNRGHNQPCIDLTTGRCHITSQNHGYAVDATSSSCPLDWFETFVNANDETNEGVAHVSLPFFSVQFHPEACAGPHDTAFLFDKFFDSAAACRRNNPPVPVFDSVTARKMRRHRLGKVPSALVQPEQPIRKVIVLGSGGLSIGQAGEFDYSGSQAIKALNTRSVRTVLINPNIATVQTSPGLADKVYYLPVTPENVVKVAENERPDAILVTFGGQTALNCGVKLHQSGDLDRLGLKVLGTPIEAILDTEDRERFNARLAEIGEPFADSRACNSIDDCLKAAKDVGYPVIIRAAFALGGLGSGFADNPEELTGLASRAFSASSQVLVERSMKGWKEIEYEVVRDAYDNCITVCNMENFDPLGVHTGDSIVIAPSQTLTDTEYHMLRNAAIRTVRHLGVVGECNIQYALHPTSLRYCIIEVNARLSRSSALASKATGYPLAFVAAQLALGTPLPNIENSITKETCACFEPSLDYVVVKIPRWDLKKFNRVSTHLGSSMKSVGEVMAIGRNFEEALQKAVRMTHDNYVSGFESGAVQYNEEVMRSPTDQRLLAIADGLAKGVSVETIHKLTMIDKWFLLKLESISQCETMIRGRQDLSDAELVYAKELGFSDRQIAKLIDDTELVVRRKRLEADIRPIVKQIDTVAAEFPAKTNYLYVTYSGLSASLEVGSQILNRSCNTDANNTSTDLSSTDSWSASQEVSCKLDKNDDVTFDEHGIIVLGCGAYRIGSSVEFDCCAVAATRTLRSQNARSVMINYNPETVSTDYDECDRLYFEELSFERVLDIYHTERSSGIIVSMGGQLANNIAMALHRQAARILGTTPEMIDSAENRYKFSRMCDKIGVDQPKWKELSSIEDAKAFCADVGYPVLVRPSYVLSGAAMNVAHKSEDLEAYLSEAARVSPDCPVVISKFILEAKEIEVDAVARKGDLVMHVICEHVENAGVHSGDATLVLPPQDLDEITVKKVEEATAKVARALNVTGPMNIQFIAKNNEIKVIECNLRASRSFPFVSKTIGLDLAKLATKVMLGKPVKPYPVNVQETPFVGVKVAQFSFTRLLGADPILGVEMSSTGEVACYGATREEAYMKCLIATSCTLPKRSICISIGTYKDKLEFLSSAKVLKTIGIKIFATPGTADFLQEHGIDAEVALWPAEKELTSSEGKNTVEKMLRDGRIEFFINIPSNNSYRRLASFESNGYRVRRACVDYNIPLLTNIKCAKLFVKVLNFMKSTGTSISLGPYDSRYSARVITFPGLILLDSPMPLVEEPDTDSLFNTTSEALRGGFCRIGFSPVSGEDISNEALKTLLQAFQKQAAVDFSLYALARPGNASLLKSLVNSCGGLKIHPTKKDMKEYRGVDVWFQHLKLWPDESPVVINASGSTLAAILYAAILNSREVHVTNLRRKDDIELIQRSKEQGIRITCDVNVLDLYATEGSARIDRKDQESLWENLEVIDVVVGPPNLILPLLLQSVSVGRMSLQWVQTRLYDNPSKILRVDNSLRETTSIEIDLDERWEAPAASDVAFTPCCGRVRRVVFNSAVVFTDGKVWARKGQGRRIVGEWSQKTATKDGNPRMSKLTSDTRKDSETRQAVHRQNVSFDEGSSISAAEPLADPSFRQGSPLQTGFLHDVDGWGKETSEPVRSSLSSIISENTDSNEYHYKTPQDAVQGMNGDISSNKMKPKAVELTPLPPMIEKLPGYGNGWWAGRHILSVSQLTRQDLHKLFEVAQEIRTMVSRVGYFDLLKGKVMASLFYEPSTRTSCSFQAAMQRLGGTVLNINDVLSSSIAKGESLGDTIQTLCCYSDVIVMRHPDKGSSQDAASLSRIPIINAGDGIGEHPTQAMLDVFTIREELGTVNGLTVTFIGDLKNGRTVHSLARVLAMYDVRLHYVSPDELRMPEDVLEALASRGVEQKEHTKLSDDVVRETDVLYVTRVQKERFKSVEEYNRMKGAYTIEPKTLTKAKEQMIIMHPLPRVGEISRDVDSDPRAVYFRQMEHGMYVRMALLAMVLGKN